jgi:hypothetical protein
LYESQSGCRYCGFVWFWPRSAKNSFRVFDSLNPKGTPVYSDLRRYLLIHTRPPLGGSIG